MTRLPVQNERWLAVLPHDSASALGSARLCPGIEVAATADELWLRGSHFTAEIGEALKGVSGLEWREPLPGNRWRHPGDLLPGGVMPVELTALDWRPLSQALVPDMPELSLSDPVALGLPLRILPGGPEHPANLLLLPVHALCAWAESAPEVRLKPLRFAVNAAGLALVHGTPLPPLHGDPWWESGGIAIPCGFHSEPDLSPEILRQVLEVPPESRELTLLHPSGAREQIPGESLVPLNRASARMSAALQAMR
jgi:hypothetical protein